MKLFIKVSFLITLSLLVNNCVFRPYRYDLHQGVPVSQEKVAQIHPGMDEERVRLILGTPLLQDVFHARRRWDYIYYLKPSYGEEVQQHLIVHFTDGKVESISMDQLHPSHNPRR